MSLIIDKHQFNVSIDRQEVAVLQQRISKWILPLLIITLTVLSIVMTYFYWQNGLGLAYNDARSHLNIGRRVVEGLKPGLAQLGSVWLPLPHILMIFTIWNDFMWHTGLAGTLQSMISFIGMAVVVYKLLERLHVSLLGRLVGVGILVTNLNILYLQSTAMTELLLLATMTMGVYELVVWHLNDRLFNLIRAAFWIMLSTLIRYDGWFLVAFASLLVFIQGYKKSKFKTAEGLFVLFCTMGGLGIFLWLVWNAAIFKDPFFFAFGPYSAHAQQQQLYDAGVLITKSNLPQSLETYWYALAFNSNTFFVLLSMLGTVAVFISKKISTPAKLALTALFSPLFFNILALYLGHSVLFVQGINGDTWFNIRYGIMMMPSIAVFIGYLVHVVRPQLKVVLIGLILFVTMFAFINGDAVTIDDGRVGSSQKNVSEVSNWLIDHAADKEGFILISAASHDAIIFSSGLPMKRFIHEGTGTYWQHATATPDRWARWIVMRTNDENDQTFKLVHASGQLDKYSKVDSYPFADIYELKPEYFGMLNTTPILAKQR